MESLQDDSVSSSTFVGTPSPETVSLGKSRYGRTRRPKISQDFCNIDDVVIDDDPPQRHSPLKSPKLKPPPKSPIHDKEFLFEIEDEFTKLDDLEMKVANNFKMNLQRGLDDTIKERKFFKSVLENKPEVTNVDVDKVLKLISNKPMVTEVCEPRTPKTVLKTYSNRRKHPHDDYVVESFGLPDEPIIPVSNPLLIERNNRIDVDVSCKGDVNLVNPWDFQECDAGPLYASEPGKTIDEIHFSRGGMLNLLSYDAFLHDKADIDKMFEDTNFEKSRIPTVVPIFQEKKENIKNGDCCEMENISKPNGLLKRNPLSHNFKKPDQTSVDNRIFKETQCLKNGAEVEDHSKNNSKEKESISENDQIVTPRKTRSALINQKLNDSIDLCLEDALTDKKVSKHKNNVMAKTFLPSPKTIKKIHQKVVDSPKTIDANHTPEDVEMNENNDLNLPTNNNKVTVKSFLPIKKKGVRDEDSSVVIRKTSDLEPKIHKNKNDVKGTNFSKNKTPKQLAPIKTPKAIQKSDQKGFKDVDLSFKNNTRATELQLEHAIKDDKKYSIKNESRKTTELESKKDCEKSKDLSVNKNKEQISKKTDQKRLSTIESGELSPRKTRSQSSGENREKQILHNEVTKEEGIVHLSPRKTRSRQSHQNSDSLRDGILSKDAKLPKNSEIAKEEVKEQSNSRESEQPLTRKTRYQSPNGVFNKSINTSLNIPTLPSHSKITKLKIEHESKSAFENRLPRVLRSGISNQIIELSRRNVRVVLNPLSCAQKAQKNMVVNPARVKKAQRRGKIRRSKGLKNGVQRGEFGKFLKKNEISQKILKNNIEGGDFDGFLEKNQVAKNEVNTVKEREDKKSEEMGEAKIKSELIDFEVGDLVWSKIGSHPYWPCLITTDPTTDTYKKFVVNRSAPLYHVTFFGDNGRRSWVSAHHIMLYYAKDDLEKMANTLKVENKVKLSYIQEAYMIKKSSKLAKWQRGVTEAEYLKYRTPEERTGFFTKQFSGKTDENNFLELEIKKERLEEEYIPGKRARPRGSTYQKNKKIKIEYDELEVKEEILERTGSSISEVLESSKKEFQEEIKNSLVESPKKKYRKILVEEKTSTKITEVGSIRWKSRLRNSHESTNIYREISDADDSVDGENTPSVKEKKINQKAEDPLFILEETPPKTKKFKEERFSKASLEARKKLRGSQTKAEPVEDSPDKPNELVKKLRSSQIKKEQEISEESPKQIDAPKNNKRLSTDESNKRQNKIETIEIPDEVPKRISTEETFLPEDKVLNKRHQIPGEYSNSDTDSKFSDNSSVPTSLKTQAAMFKRNNIFRGVSREKVCQICEKGDGVFKCKGSCNGVYHVGCAMNLPLSEEQDVKEVEGQEEANKDAERNGVEIISFAPKSPLPNLSASPNFKGMSLAEKIDFRMKEIMKKFDYQSVYAESADSSSEDVVPEESTEKPGNNQTKLSLTVTNKPTQKEIPIIKHVTADNISYICVTDEKPKDVDVQKKLIEDNAKESKCAWCSTDKTPNCLVCNKDTSDTGSSFRQKCSLHQCGKYYHPGCLKAWPQTQWSVIQTTKDKNSDSEYDTFVCPNHVCHTCISDDPHVANSRCPSDKIVKCLRCPATYHSSSFCVPAGTEILSSSQIICPRHFVNPHSKRGKHQTINTNWCFICSEGGNLICCETCPTSVHIECIPGDFNKDDTFFCEDCQSGRLPLYDEIVWVKLGSYRWWPAVILFPNDVPDNLQNKPHCKGQFVVKFYGTHDHIWTSRGRTFLFQEGDKGHTHSTKKSRDNAFVKAIEEATAVHQLKKKFKLSMVAEKKIGLKPPVYIKIKVNKPVGNVKLFDGDTSNTTSCDCDPNQPHPCGPESDCLNRLLLTECNPDVCPAGERCNNQCFEKREYPPLVPHHTQHRGWGLKTLAPVRKGQFVIEYVGELIDEQEYQRRVQKMHEQKEENYYFLTIDKDRMLDAGPKGNVARFMNHSCMPNCETQKWTVNGDTRVGLFASCDIPADTELTFNYNLECIGKEKKKCRCGAPNCSGYIGVKVKQLDPPKKTNTHKLKKKKPSPEVVVIEDPCFVCGKTGDVSACNNKICTKYYHLACVDLTSWPEGGKWVCQWHNCNFCSKRTIRCCVKCINSYCPPHSHGTIRYDKTLGFVCFKHDPLQQASTSRSVPKEDNDLDSMSLSMRLNCCVTSTPVKKENTASTVKSKNNRIKKKGKRRL